MSGKTRSRQDRKKREKKAKGLETAKRLRVKHFLEKKEARAWIDNKPRRALREIFRKEERAAAQRAAEGIAARNAAERTRCLARSA